MTQSAKMRNLENRATEGEMHSATLREGLTRLDLPTWALDHNGGKVSNCGHTDSRKLFSELASITKTQKEAARITCLFFIRDLVTQALDAYWPDASRAYTRDHFDFGVGSCSRLPPQYWLQGIPRGVLKRNHQLILAMKFLRISRWHRSVRMLFNRFSIQLPKFWLKIFLLVCIPAPIRHRILGRK